jgi:hypothetical protein
MTQPNPLLIPELADQCLLHLVESRADLEACALVSQVWVFAAQRHLFREIFLDSEDLCRVVEKTFHGSPHLVPHISTPRGRLQSPTPLDHLRRLFSLPTGHHVKLDTKTPEFGVFMPLSKTCSSGIRHLHLWSKISSDPTHPFRRPSSSKVLLESLRLNHIDTREWMNHGVCPFDFSILAVLSLHTGTSILRSDMKPALRTIEVLEFMSTQVRIVSYSQF